MAYSESSENVSVSSLSISEATSVEKGVIFLSRWQESDVIFIVEEKELHAHRDILMMHSPVFKAMLDGHFKEATQEKIELKEKSYEDMLAFLKLLYPPSMLETKDEVIDIVKMLALADEYQTLKLINQLLRPNVITPSNALKILPFAMEYDSDVCGIKCMKIAQTSTRTEVLKEGISGLDNDLAQRILLKKCEILENIVKESQSHLEKFMASNGGLVTAAIAGVP